MLAHAEAAPDFRLYSIDLQPGWKPYAEALGCAFAAPFDVLEASPDDLVAAAGGGQAGGSDEADGQLTVVVEDQLVAQRHARRVGTAQCTLQHCEAAGQQLASFRQDQRAVVAGELEGPGDRLALGGIGQLDRDHSGHAVQQVAHLGIVCAVDHQDVAAADQSAQVLAGLVLDSPFSDFTTLAEEKGIIEVAEPLRALESL